MRHNVVLLVTVIGLIACFVNGKPEFRPPKEIKQLDVDPDAVVQLADGTLVGNLYDSYRAFLGIPYAAPPVEDMRFLPPQPNDPWSPNTLMATTFSVGCPQNCELPPGTCPNATSEDCLYLDVYTPRDLSTGPWPVLFYMPGGRFEQGSAMTTLYTGEFLSNNSQLVLVTINYRLGALGFYISSSVPGNIGLMDQRLALTWVQENIAAFGGDPSRVTLSGQSAGATSTAMHLVSKSSAGLFQQAVIQSNPWTITVKLPTQAETISARFATDLGCQANDLVCLQKANITSVLAAQQSAQQHVDYLDILPSFMPWLPVVDGDDIAQDPMDAFKSGNFNKVPVIVGTVSEEALLFIYQAWAKPLSELEYEALLATIFYLKAPEVYEFYKPINNDTSDYRPIVSELGTHYIFTCPTRAVARSLAQYVPVFEYYFNHVWSFDGWGPGYPYCVGHVCHGSELPFLFDSGVSYFDAGEQALSEQQIAYWGNYVHNATTNPGPFNVGASWPQYSSDQDGVIDLTIAPYSRYDVLQKYCDFWDTIGYGN